MPLTAAEVLSAGLKPPTQEQKIPSPVLQPTRTSSADMLLEALAGSKPDAFEKVLWADQGEDAQDPQETESEAAGALLVLTGCASGKLSHNQVEHNRRLRAKQLFDELRLILPGGSDDNGKFKDRNALLHIAVDVLRAANGEPTDDHDMKLEGDSNPSESDAEGSHKAVGGGLYCEILASGVAFEGVPEGASSSSSAINKAAGGLCAESEEHEKKLSHSEAEQRRRLLARNYYTELRQLLPGPDTERMDKNAILQRTIERLKEVAAETAACEPVLQDLQRQSLKLEGDANDDAAEGTEGGGGEQQAAVRLAAALLASESRCPLSESPPDVVMGLLSLVASRRHQHPAHPIHTAPPPSSSSSCVTAAAASSAAAAEAPAPVAASSAPALLGTPPLKPRPLAAPNPSTSTPPLTRITHARGAAAELPAMERLPTAASRARKTSLATRTELPSPRVGDVSDAMEEGERGSGDEFNNKRMHTEGGAIVSGRGGF